MKKLPLFLFMCLLLFSLRTVAQVTFGTVDPGPYIRGNTIAVPLIISTNGSCLASNNIFQLYISDASGNFASTTPIGTYSGFFTTYINGTIPNLTVGTYKLMVKTTAPAASYIYSGTIQVLTSATLGASPAVTPTTNSQILSANTTYGWCGSAVGDNKSMILQGNGTAAKLTLKNEKTGTSQDYFPNPFFELNNLAMGYYTITVSEVGATKSSRSYLLLNVPSKISIESLGPPTGCIDPALGTGADISYSVNTLGENGIQNNYPGSTYRITWGDGQPDDVLTHCQLIVNGGEIHHIYKRTSCGQPPIDLGNGSSIKNSFKVSVSSINPFCSSDAITGTVYPKIFSKPTAKIDESTPTTGCLNTSISFRNASTDGNNADCTVSMQYTWYVNDVIKSTNKDFVYTFTAPGIYKITLKANNDVNEDVCKPNFVSRDICIQAKPQPSFNFNGAESITVCAPMVVKPTNTTILDENCNTTKNYLWTVTGGTITYASGTNQNSFEPEFRFSNPGVYQVTLSVTTASCGVFNTLPKTVIVNGPPVATLSPDVELCNLGSYNFSATAGTTKTILSGTQQDLADTYFWEVSGGDYTFDPGSTPNSKYPKISFSEYKIYTVKVTHKNTCSTTSDTQVLTFTTSPVINAGPDQSICFNDAVQLNGTITGSVSTQAWVGGNGTFSPNRNTLTAIYTPSAAERNLGTVNLILRATTTLAAPCNTIDDDMDILIKPRITVTSLATSSVCTGIALNYPITANLTGTTFSWTATGSANATGYAAAGTGDVIPDQITNTNALTNATVTYIITPSNDGCAGEPFTLTVTITPNPVLTATPANAVICNNTSSAITLASNLGTTTRYTWTSTVTGDVTGNSTGPIASGITSINDILFNSGTTPGTVTYTITPISINNCTGNPVSVTVTVEPAVTIANAGPDESICDATTYTFKANAPSVGTGKWTLFSGQPGIAFIDDTQYNTQVSGLQPGQNYTFRWTISGSSCPSTIDDVVISVNQLSVGGTTSGAATVCAGSNGNSILLTGQNGTVTNWESSIDGGATWQTIANTANSYTYSNLTVTTQFRAVVKNGSCLPENSSITTITVSAGTVVAATGADQTLCNEASTTITANAAAPNTGIWTLVSGNPAGVTITTPTSATTTVTGLVGGQTYVFRWTISGTAPCPETLDEVTITDLATIQNSITNTTLIVCTGQTITVNGSQPIGGDNSYTYEWQISNDNGSTWSVIPDQANQNLTYVLTASSSFRRIVKSSICSSTSNVVTVNVRPPIGNNSISGDQTICAGTKPINPLTGTTPTGGDGSYTYQWESSSDNGNTWGVIIGATTAGYTVPILNDTTLYRRKASTSDCAGSLANTSNVVTIIVRPNAIAEFTFTRDIDCPPFTITSADITATPYPDRNATYAWYVGSTNIGNDIMFPGTTIQSGSSSIEIKLVVTSSLGCSIAEFSHTFSTREQIEASYTQSKTTDCGNTTVIFTNTSPAVTGATYEWNFGNGVISPARNPASQTFLPSKSGSDTTYYISLTVKSPCGNDSFESTVIVKSKPVALLSPTSKISSCSPLDVTFVNISTGSSNSYTYDYGQGPQEGPTANTNVSHRYIYNTAVGGDYQDYYAKLTAVNSCGTSTSDIITIRVYPSTSTPVLVVDPNQLRGCAPHTVTFNNYTVGAISYRYNFDDGSQEIPTASKNPVTYRFDAPGTYVVKLTALNECGNNPSTTVTIIVDPTPVAIIGADRTEGCPGTVIQFRNNSTDATSYLWEFGDGSTSTDFEPSHLYAGTQEFYTVKLTATNFQGCSSPVINNEYIHITPAPVAKFNVLPAMVIGIPDYTFRFEDESTNNPIKWEWDFGDGATSLERNPSHTYPDTGHFAVTLRVTTAQDCFSTVSKTVQITGVPGYLFIPNSFMPNSSVPELREFRAKGSGMASWKMSIFNKWGQILWETDKLDDGRPVEGWDGTYKATPVPQGVYYWKIDVQMISGTPWKGMSYNGSNPKRTGSINLIR